MLKHDISEYAEMHALRSLSFRSRYFCLCGALLLLGGSVQAGAAAEADDGGWTAQASGNRFWSGIASSADGGKLVACVNTGRIYTSADAGKTWTARAFEQDWVDVACSADGATIAATWDMDFWISTDSGVTWTQKLGAWNGWGDVACSADGTKIAVYTTYNYGAGYLVHVSTDGGDTFEYRNGQDLPYSDVAMSADGGTIAACVAGGRIWISEDTGATWTAREDTRNWSCVAMSANGSRLLACVDGGHIYTSDDKGANWTAREETRNWCAAAASADGMTLAAHDRYGYLYLSTNAGETWTPCGFAGNFQGLALSADGATLATGAWAGPVYTLDTASAAMPAEAVASVEMRHDEQDAVHAGSDEGNPTMEAPAQAAQPDGGYLTDWLVAGPLGDEIPPGALPRGSGGAGAAPREGETLPGCEQRWTRYRAEGNVINLRLTAGYDTLAHAIAFREFHSDIEQRGHIHFLSQNAIQLWVNGVPVLDQPELPYQPLNWVEQEVELRRGANSCLVLASTCNAELFGFAVRVDGPAVTPPPPLVWNPLVPGVPFVDDGRYMLLSPDWRWMEGDDPDWANPGFDDSNWKVPARTTLAAIPAGGTYWMRIRGHFAPVSTLVPYTFAAADPLDIEVYLDGARIHGRSKIDAVLDEFSYRDATAYLPRECVLAVRVFSDGHQRPVTSLAVRRADKAMAEELTVVLPREHHRLFLVFLLFSSVVYYLLVYRNHPRQIEGTVCCVTVALAILSMLLSTGDSWTFNHQLPTAAWMSPVLAAIAYISGIAMVHVMAYGAVSWRAVAGYGGISVAVFASGWELDTRWVAFSIFPLMALEYVRVWVMYDLVPRRANRGAVGIGLVFFVTCLVISALYGPSNGRYFPAAGPYAHLYGLVGFAVCLVMYTSRESAIGMHKLQGLTATLEDRVAERTRQVEQLTHRLIAAGEAEREQLSRDLHDSVAQTLWSARMTAESRQANGAATPQGDELMGLLDKAIGEVRAIAYGLRPPELDKLGFLQAISQLCKDFSYASGILLDYEVRGVDNETLNAAAEVNLYRVLQEALNNVQQHAGASSVRVRLVGAYPSVILRVEDNGKGFDMAAPDKVPGGTMGLRGMAERVRLLGGTMHIRTAPGEGVRLAFEIPQQGKED